MHMFYVQFMRFPVLDLLCDILASYKCVEANSEYTSYDIVVITYLVLQEGNQILLCMHGQNEVYSTSLVMQI